MRHALDKSDTHGRPLILAIKVLALLASAWGLAYPALLWGLGRVLG